MEDESSRKYLFVAIDRASRWVYLDIFPDKTAASAQSFLERVVEKAPFKITKLLTDNELPSCVLMALVAANQKA